jgi:hypothetical protein
VSGSKWIETACPFGEWLAFLVSKTGYHLDDLNQYSDRLMLAYLAWEYVRDGRNPYFRNGTGLEGYLIGRVNHGEEARETLALIGQRILDVAVKRHGSYGWADSIFRIAANQELHLTDRKRMREVLDILDSVFGAELARQRSQMLLCSEAVKFRQETYELVKLRPDINHTILGGKLVMSYCLPSETVNDKQELTMLGLNPHQQEGLLVAMGIGRMGVPAIRILVLGQASGWVELRPQDVRA